MPDATIHSTRFAGMGSESWSYFITRFQCWQRRPQHALVSDTGTCMTSGSLMCVKTAPLECHICQEQEGLLPIELNSDELLV